MNFVYPIGTKVRLASGGPEMLVVDIDPVAGRVLCSWKSDGTVSEHWFASVCLDIARRRYVLER